MAQLSLGEARWRMIRRAVRKKRFRYSDARSMSRGEDKHFDWLLANGFVTKLGEDDYELTPKAKAAAADLGFYEI